RILRLLLPKSALATARLEGILQYLTRGDRTRGALAPPPWAWQIFRESSRLGQEAVPVVLPGARLLQGLQGHEGLGVVGVPAHPPPLEPLRRRLAHGLRWPAADLPAGGPELRVQDHGFPLRHLPQEHQPRPPPGPAQPLQPGAQLLVQRRVALV